MAQTAMAEAMERAGVDRGLVRLDMTLARLATDHAGAELWVALAEEVRKDAQMRNALCRFYVAHKMPGEGPEGHAGAGRHPHADARQPNRERGAIYRAPQGHRIPAPAREQSVGDRAAAARVANVVSLSVLDSYKLRGKVIGDVTIAELREIVRLGLHDAALGNRILAYIGNPDPSAPVRRYISAAVLQGMLAGVNSHAA